MKRLFCTLLLALVSLPAFADDLVVFAAASLTNALGDIGKVYEARTGNHVKFSFAASSTLAKQIENGATAGYFFSADEEWMDYLDQKKLIVRGTRADLLGNSLVLIVPTGSTLKIDVKPGFDLAGLLGSGRLSTGDPAHVPVGKYAEEALRNLGVWASVQGRIAPADSVRSAMALVEQGEAPVGIVYATDAAVSTKVRVAGAFPASSHKPVTYPAGIVAGQDTKDARAFADFVRSKDAAEIFRKYGFTVLQ